MITALSLHNFKAFEKLDIELKPITLILGPNNSGKSSIISALRLLAQTLESRDPDVPLLLNGIMGDLGTYKDIVFLNNKRKVIEIGIKIDEFPQKENVVPSNDLRFISKVYPENNIEINLAYKFRNVRRELVLASCEVLKDKRFLIKAKYVPDNDKMLIEVLDGKSIPTGLRSPVSSHLRMKNFIPQVSLYTEMGFELDEVLRKKTTDSLRQISFSGRAISSSIENIEYLSAMRVPPQRLYSYSGERRTRIGASGENTANILAMNKARGERKSFNIANSVGAWLAQAQIASDLSISSTSDRFYEIKIQNPKTNEIENLADVGLGISQILPVLVGGYNLNPGATYLVEEPEIHLHPRAQAELGSFFYDLYIKGIQSIVETHSEYLVIRLQQYVADKKISPKDIQFLYIDTENDKKVVKTLELDNDAIFKQDWPGGFFPEKLEEAKKLAIIRALNKRKLP